MHRDMFAEDIVVADAQARRLVLVLQILRRVADDAAGVKLVARAYRRHPGKINVRPDHTVRTQLHAFINHGIRPDPDGGIQFCPGMNDGGWMNHEIKVTHWASISKSKMRTARRCFVPCALVLD